MFFDRITFPWVLIMRKLSKHLQINKMRDF